MTRRAPVPVQCPVVAVNHNPKTATDPEGRWQAFRMSAELLVGFRRIFQRGLLRLHGAGWVDAACPTSLRSRLERRRDSELEVDRFGASADEPIDYTTFADLVEILESDEALAEMLGGLSSSPDGLDGNLRTLDDVRRKVAAARLLSDSELVVLTEMHLRLREKLAGAKRRARSGGSATEAVEEAAVGSVFDERAEDGEPEEDPGGVAIGGSRDDDPEVAADPVMEPTQNVAAGVNRPTRRPSSRAAEVFDGASTPVGLVHVERDDLQVLRDLRLEIIAAAEAAYGYSDAVDTTVWTRALDSGWFADKVEAYGLGDVSTFYAILEGFLDRHRRGGNRESLRTFLADRELAKLLLRLRELFDRLRV